MTTDPKKMPSDPRPRRGEVWVAYKRNQRINGPKDDRFSVLRHYLPSDIEKALRSWGKLDEDDRAFRKAVETVEKAAKAMNTRVFEVFFVESGSYLSFIFECNTDIVGAVINGRKVHHAVQLPGSVPYRGNLWETKLPGK